MKYNLQVHGCAMNVSDGERLASVMERAGFEREEDWKKADCVVYVSCSIKKTAEDKILGSIRENVRLKQGNSNIKIGLTGCMVRKTSCRGDEEEDVWIKKINGLDFAFRIEELEKMPSMLSRVYGQEFRFGIGVKMRYEKLAKKDESVKGVELEGELFGLRVYDRQIALLSQAPPRNDTQGLVQEFDPGKSDYFRVQPRSSSSFQGLLPIMMGCNKFCTYCIVPYSRGRERSRLMGDVVEEAKRMVESGRTELLLLGQNVNSYGLTNEVWSGSKRGAFIELLRRLDAIDGVKRIRFTSPHPRDMTEEVIDAVVELPNVCEWLHMPLQSGSNRVLKRMNRGYTQEQYLRQIEYIRKRMPRGGLTTDIIVGFCGETLEDHAETRKVMELAKFDIAYISQYSQRGGTYAAGKLADDVSAEEKKRRFHELNDEVLVRTSYENNLKYVGEVWEALVEKVEEGLGFRGQGVVMGRLRTYRVVKIGTPSPRKARSSPLKGGASSLRVGAYVRVNITGVREWILEGELVKDKEEDEGFLA